MPILDPYTCVFPRIMWTMKAFRILKSSCPVLFTLLALYPVQTESVQPVRERQPGIRRDVQAQLIQRCLVPFILTLVLSLSGLSNPKFPYFAWHERPLLQVTLRSKMPAENGNRYHEYCADKTQEGGNEALRKAGVPRQQHFIEAFQFRRSGRRGTMWLRDQKIGRYYVPNWYDAKVIEVAL